jgi:carboxynorspermidine decarboxylase
MFKDYPTPYFLVYEARLRRNLDVIRHVADAAGVSIIMAFKANALWRTFPVFREYGVASTASSVNEMLLANDELGRRAHTYCPAYTDATIDAFLSGSSHISFNSLRQYLRFEPKVKAYNSAHPSSPVSCGLRINPMCSVVDTGIYDPCSPGSRFGVVADDLHDLPDGIEGFHFHALCESSSYDLEKVLDSVESQFGKYIPRLKWINMGGGHLMTRKDYDVDHLISLLRGFKSRYPGIQVILEPGSAFTWQTGDLISSVVDVVTNSGISTAIVDVSFACHMPDCLEMPYKPAVSEALPDVDHSKPTYRIGGNSCLSGDFVGDWSFEKALSIGDRLTFEDMNHYTTVKTNMFNGIQHPSILYQHIDGSVEVLRVFDYNDYKNRMS